MTSSSGQIQLDGSYSKHQEIRKAKVTFLLLAFLMIFLIVAVVVSFSTQNRSEDKLLLSQQKSGPILIIGRINRLIKRLGLTRIVVWGHPLGSHTHSYIHQGFYHALEQIPDIDIKWCADLVAFNQLDQTDQPTLFLSEGQVLQDMPDLPQHYYLLHNSERHWLKSQENHRVGFQFYHTSCRDKSYPFFNDFQRIDDSYHIYMPWATHLLPHEFLPMKTNHEFLLQHETKYDVAIIGQHGEAYEERIREFISGLTVEHPNVFRDRSNTLTDQDMATALRSARLAPALMNTWQKEQGYIPCRLMKNISMGLAPITTSSAGYEMLYHEPLYDDNEARLAEHAYQWANPSALAYDLVQQHHTYLNRWELLLMALVYKSRPPALPKQIFHTFDQPGAHHVLQAICQVLGIRCAADPSGSGIMKSLEWAGSDTIRVWSKRTMPSTWSSSANKTLYWILPGTLPFVPRDNQVVLSSDRSIRKHLLTQGTSWGGPFADMTLSLTDYSSKQAIQSWSYVLSYLASCSSD